MGPLARRAPGRLARSGVWGVLVAGAFLLLASAAAAAPLFAEAAGNAALIARLGTVPIDAAAADAPVVRVVGGQGASGRVRLGGGLDRIPGLTAASATATSIGVESRPKTIVFTPFVAADADARGATDPTSDEGIERARIFGDDDLAHALVPAPGQAARPGAPADGAGPPRIWVPAPLAAALRIGARDQVIVGVQTGGRVKSAAAVVAGVYAVAADGRVPADPPGSNRWTYRRGGLPVDSEFTTLPAFLLVTDVASAELLARTVGDDMLYAVEGQLRSPRPTLAEATATVAGIRRRQVEVRDPALGGDNPGPFHEQVVSGLPTIVADAGRVADRSVAWTRTVGAAGLVLGLLAVLAVAVFGLVRRTVEVRHATGLGVRPATLGVLAGVEMLPVAVLCSGAGLLVGWGLMAWVGPAGAITATGLRAAAEHAVLAVGGGTLLVVAAATLAAIQAEQLTASNRSSRTVPWEPLLLAIAVTAAAGLFVRPADAGPPSPLDLLVPVLVLAATGAVGARLALRLVATLAGRNGGLTFQRRPVLALAARRISAGGRSAVLLITVLTLGFGFLIYSLAAASSVRQVTADRTAVLAGAQATVVVEASWLLDPGAAQLPQQDQPPVLDMTLGDEPPVPGVRTPPLQAGTTIVWRSRITVPPEYANLDLLVVDPRRFATVAEWGTGPELARAKARLAGLATADERVAARMRGERLPADAGAASPTDRSIPAIGVGAVLQHAGDKAAITTLLGDVPIEIMDVVPAFPGASGALPTVVVPADSFFSYLGTADPRVRPPARSSRFNRPPSEYSPALWSATNLGSLQDIMTKNELAPGLTTSYSQAAQNPDLVAARGSTGYQMALGLCVAGLAVLGLAMFAERSVTKARAADLMLNRMGLGAGGIGRARAVELAVFAVIALLLAGAGVAVIVPFGARLLDPGGASAPAFVLRLDRAGLLTSLLAAAVAVLLAVLVSRARGTRSNRASRAAGAVLRDAD